MNVKKQERLIDEECLDCLIACYVCANRLTLRRCVELGFRSYPGGVFLGQCLCVFVWQMCRDGSLPRIARCSHPPLPFTFRQCFECTDVPAARVCRVTRVIAKALGRHHGAWSTELLYLVI